MNEEVLKEVGLTQGEIRVYKACIKLGESSTGAIMKKSNISSSKVYLILDKLIEKGFIAFSIKNNIKIFSPSNPSNILEFISKKQESLKKVQADANNLVKELTSLINTSDEETAKVYVGEKSLRTAFQNILDSLKSNEPFLFIGAQSDEVPALELFFQNLHAKREENRINTIGLISKSSENQYKSMFKKRKNIKLKTINLQFPHSLAIGKDRIIISLWNPSIIGFEIISKRIAERYKSFFLDLANQSQ